MFYHPPSSCSSEHKTSLIKETKGEVYINITHINVQFSNSRKREKC